MNAKVEAHDAAIRNEILDKDARIDAQARRIAELEARVAVAESMRAELLAMRATQDDVAVLKAALQELLRERAGGVTQARLAPAKP